MFGARFTKYQLEPAPLPSVSISLSSGRPSAFAKAMASATAWMMPAHMIWLVAFAAWPEPVGAEVRHGAAHRLQHRARRARTPPRAADHDRERSVAGAFDAAADRGVEELDLPGSEPAAPPRARCPR